MSTILIIILVVLWLVGSALGFFDDRPPR